MTIDNNLRRYLSLDEKFKDLNIVLHFDYDHMRRRKISPKQKWGTTGCSWVLGFRINKLHLSYGRASLFPGYTSNQFSLLCNLSEFYKKKG